MRRLESGVIIGAIILLILGIGLFIWQRQPRDVLGTVRDKETGQTIAGAFVRAGQRTAYSDTAGHFVLTALPPDSRLSVSASGYLPQDDIPLQGAFLESHWTATVLLQATLLQGTVTDQAGKPIPDTTVAAAGQVTYTDSLGHFSLRRIPAGSSVQVAAYGFLPVTATFQPGQPLYVTLEPNTLAGTVVEEGSGQPVPGATVTAAGKSTLTDATGRYFLRRIPPGAAVTVQADGYISATYTFTADGEVRTALQPNALTGLVMDAEDGRPIAGATVQEGARTVQADAQGRYILRKVPQAAVLQATADGYLPARLPVQGRAVLDITLQPNLVQGTVRDALSGRPVVSATVTLDGRTTQTDAAGHYVFRRVKRGQSIVAMAPGYVPASVVFNDGDILDIALRPGHVSGTVRDAVTGRPIAGATLSVNGISTVSREDGTYEFGALPTATVLTAKHPGYRLARIPLGAVASTHINLEPFMAKGIYLPFGTVFGQGGEKARALLEAAAKAGLNAVVIDVTGDIRGDVGRLAYKSRLPLAQRIGASRASSEELSGLLAFAKERGFYTIARIMVFKDDLLARGAPEMAIKNKRTGGLWLDSGGSYWADPYNSEVWAYKLGIAKECAALGFDEIQFDYLRLPSDGEIEQIVYPAKAADDARKRWEVIEGLMAQIPKELPHVYVSIDTFGWTAWREDDLGIGQRIVDLAKYVDYISPMVYPSTFDAGGLDYPKPSEHPYEVVYRSAVHAAGRIGDFKAKLRPWLQDFDDYAFGIHYGAAEVRAQIKAAEDAKTYGWLLWNPAGIYTQEAWQR